MHICVRRREAHRRRLRFQADVGYGGVAADAWQMRCHAGTECVYRTSDKLYYRTSFHCQRRLRDRRNLCNETHNTQGVLPICDEIQ